MGFNTLKRVVARWTAAGLVGLACAWAIAQQPPPLVIKPLAERHVTELPAGDLYWRIETLGSRAPAQAAAGPWSLIAEADGRIWLFTLEGAGGSSPGATKVTEVGPIPRVQAARYLLRINDASGPPDSVTSIHPHPGSEAFFVLAGEQIIRGAHGVLRVRPGQAEAGHGADNAMQVSSSGSSDLHALVMFVVDADRLFSTPATIPQLPLAPRRAASRWLRRRNASNFAVALQAGHGQRQQFAGFV